MVFSYSRWQFIRFTPTANAHSVCHSHVLAFEKAGGVPHEILYDRMKQVVLESYADHVVFHPLFAALVKHYGFKPIPLAPGYKEGKDHSSYCTSFSRYGANWRISAAVSEPLTRLCLG